MKYKSLIISLAINLFLVLAFAFADCPTGATCWNGSVDNNWFNDQNWTTDLGAHVKPDINTDAYINYGKAIISGTVPAAAHSLILGLDYGDSGSVSVNGGSLSLPTGGTFDLNVSPIEGAIYVGYQGSGSLEIINGGTVTCGFGFIAALFGDGVRAASNGVVTVDGASSSWTVEPANGNNVLFIGGMDSTTDNGGTGLLSITNGGLVTVIHSGGSYAARVGTSGTLTGNSMLTLSSPGHPENYAAAGIVVRGTVAPTRELTIDGSLLYQAPASTVCDVIAGDNPNQAHINVEEVTSLHGRLSVTMTGTFTVGPTRFLLLHSEDALSSTFSQGISITYPTRQAICPHIIYDYDGNNVYLDTVCQ
jgi:hypothetical protein